MNYGTLPGFGRKPVRPRYVVGLPGGLSGGVALAPTAAHGDVSTASGAVTAGSLVPVLRHIGSGILHRLYIVTANATVKTIGLRVVLDGIEIFNGDIASSGASRGHVLVGQVVYDGAFGSTILSSPIPYAKSLVIEYRSNVSETNGANINYRYEVTD